MPSGVACACLGRLEIGCHVASLIKDVLGSGDRHLLNERANAELLLPNDLDPYDVALRVEVQHNKTFLGPERLGRGYRGIAQPDVRCGRLGVDLNDWRLGDRDDESLNAALPNTR